MIPYSDISEFECTPPHMLLKAEEIANKILSDKSKVRYKKVYLKINRFAYKKRYKFLFLPKFCYT